VTLGRPKKITPELQAKILAHLEAGEHGVHKIAKLVGVRSRPSRESTTSDWSDEATSSAHAKWLKGNVER